MQAVEVRYREFFGTDNVYDVKLNVTGCDEVNVLTGNLHIVKIVLDVVRGGGFLDCFCLCEIMDQFYVLGMKWLNFNFLI